MHAGRSSEEEGGPPAFRCGKLSGRYRHLPSSSTPEGKHGGKFSLTPAEFKEHTQVGMSV